MTISARVDLNWRLDPIIAVLCTRDRCPEPGTRVRVGIDAEGRSILEWQGGRVAAFPDCDPENKGLVLRTGAEGIVRAVLPVRPDPPRPAWWISLERGASPGSCESVPERDFDHKPDPNRNLDF